MSSLLLVRHGQASIHAADYDQLSDLGATQSRALGRWWGERAQRVDAVYVGPQKRHRQTEAALREGAAEAGLDLPEAIDLPDVGEMDASAVFAEAMRRVAVAAPDLSSQLKEGQLSDDGRVAMRHMAGISAKLFERWADGDPAIEMPETYVDFERRVVRGLQSVMKAQRRGKQVAVITSGGPTTIALKLALGLDPGRALHLMSVIYNASVTELKYTEDRLTLGAFNQAGHLAPNLLTKV